MRHITAFSLLMTILLGMVTACHAHEHASHGEIGSISALQAHNAMSFSPAHNDDCPGESPETQHDHSCDHACYGPCHAPLAGSGVVFVCALSCTRLHPSEIIWYIPKVYLSLFVPPDSARA